MPERSKPAITPRAAQPAPAPRGWRQRAGRSGQTLVEYGIIIALVSIVVILVLQAFGERTQNLAEFINNQVDEANKQEDNGQLP
ncbi:MAG: hypothetical protein AAGK14_02445 [Verrucomicrobiota bacterium]